MRGSGKVLYAGSDGDYYGEVDIWERFEADRWVPFAWDPDSGAEWVETEDQELLELTPVTSGELPQNVAIVRTESGISAVTEG